MDWNALEKLAAENKRESNFVEAMEFGGGDTSLDQTEGIRSLSLGDRGKF